MTHVYRFLIRFSILLLDKGRLEEDELGSALIVGLVVPPADNE